MSKNAGFGTRVHRTREASRLSLEYLSAATGIALGRLQRIERGEDDQLDLTPDEIQVLSKTLRRPAAWLIFGDGISGPSPVLARRSVAAPRQQDLAFDVERCPTCGTAGMRTRCNRCGRYPE